MVPEDQRYITKRWQECNWAQALEGDVDSSHVSFLHSTLNQNIEWRGTPRERSFGLMARDPHPRFETLETESGLLIAARRDADDAHYYWRVTAYIMPYYTIIPQYGDSPIHINAWVPIDDDNTMVWSMSYRAHRPLMEDELERFRSGLYAHPAAADYQPTTFEPGSGQRTRANKENEYQQDYLQQQQSLYFAVRGLWQQDRAIVESMGPIADRWEEHLGSSDALEPSSQRIRSVAAILPRDTSWVSAIRPLMLANAGNTYTPP
jgi:hypothetical protein